MANAIAIVAFLVLAAMAAAARIAAHQRHGAHGRPDLESGHIEDPHWAASAAYNSLLRQAKAEAAGTRSNDRPATLGPVFNIGATPVPQGVSRWASDDRIRKEFHLDTPDQPGQAA